MPPRNSMRTSSPAPDLPSIVPSNRGCLRDSPHRIEVHPASIVAAHEHNLPAAPRTQQPIRAPPGGLPAVARSFAGSIPCATALRMI